MLSTAFRRQALQVLWPSFLMAGVLEMLLFAVVDPGALQWFGGEPIDWPRQAVYTATFFIFWGVMSVCGALTMLLMKGEGEVNRQDPF
ncbi:MAG TPA: hypothetical protein VGD46_04075 [Rhizobacter sp.]